MKKRFALFLIVLLCLVLPVTTWADDVRDHDALRIALNGTATTINLTADITASNWTPVNISRNLTLNGNGFVITLGVNATGGTGTTTHAGLFGSISSGNVIIRDLGIVSIGITASSQGGGGLVGNRTRLRAGGFIGSISGSTTKVTIENSFVSRSGTGLAVESIRIRPSGLIHHHAYAHAGGLIGIIEGGTVDIKNSYFNGRAKAETNVSYGAAPYPVSYAYAGGLIGEHLDGTLTITRSYSTGAVHARSRNSALTGANNANRRQAWAGGLIGKTSGGTPNITDCFWAYNLPNDINTELVPNKVARSDINNGNGNFTNLNYHIYPATLIDLPQNHAARTALIINAGMVLPGSTTINSGFPVLHTFHRARAIALNANSTNYTFIYPTPPSQTIPSSQTINGSVARSLAGTWDNVTLDGSNFTFTAVSPNPIMSSSTSNPNFTSTVRPIRILTPGSYSFSARTGGGHSVNANVAIINSPQSQTATDGGMATFSVIEGGNAPSGLTYQWQRSNDNGMSWNDIPGATSAAYLLSPVRITDDKAQFRVRATNSSNVVTTTSAAALTLIFTTTITIPQVNGQTPNTGTVINPTAVMQGEIVNLPAVTARAGFTFDRWEVDFGSVIINNPTSETGASFVMGNSNVTIMARFRPATLKFSNRTLPSGIYNTPYSANVTPATDGSGSYTYSATIPAELGLAMSTAGVISGTPNAIVNTQSFTVTARDTVSGGTETAIYTITINRIPVNNIGGTATITYSGTSINLPALSSLFTIDPNAGTARYAITGGTGAGEITGNNLTITRAGTFAIQLETVQTVIYAAGAPVIGTLTVNPAPLTFNGVTAINREYNSLTTVSITGGTLFGVFAGDSVNPVVPNTGTISNPDVGSGKPVTLDGNVTLSGADVGKYLLVQQPTGITVNILAVPIHGSVVIRVITELDNVINVGDVLFADVSGITPFGATVIYQWYRDNVPIDNATGGNYSVTADDVAVAQSQIIVKVTGTGNFTGEVISEAVEVINIPLSGSISITGETALGNVLTVNTSSVTPTGATYTIKWLRVGEEVPIATSYSYMVTEDDLGKTIEVEVTGEGNYTMTLSARINIPAVVPGAPQGLTAAAGNGQVALSWSAPKSTGGSPIIRYEVFHDNVANWINVGFNTSYVCTELDNGTEYTFRVRVINGVGNSEETTVTGTPRTVPGMPQSLTATPEDGQVTLSWSAPASNGGSPIIRYEVLYDGATNWYDVGLSTGYICDGLFNGTLYTFRVRAVNSEGNGAEATVIVTPQVHPIITIITHPAPNTNVTEGSISGSLIIAASVTQGAELNYQWYMNTTYSNEGGTQIINATGTSFTILSGLTADESPYYFYCVVEAAGATSKSSNVATVTVLPARVAGVNLNRNTLSLASGASDTLIATVEPNSASNKSVTWRSSNTAIATVDQSGVVTANSAGIADSAIITVTTEDGGHAATCVVTVQPVPVMGVRLNIDEFTLNTGVSVGLFATVTPANATNKNITWRSSNEGLATVSQSGVVTASSNSSANGSVVMITATTEDGNYPASCVVTLKHELLGNKMSLNRSSLSMIIGQQNTLSVSGIYLSNITWSSSNTDVVSEVNASGHLNSTGHITAVGPGITIITARSDNLSATCIVTVRATPIITTDTMPQGRQWEHYGETLNATGSEPITWSWLASSGSKLPPGLSLNAATGLISGTASETGMFKFTVEARNGEGSDRKEFSISIIEGNRVATPTVNHSSAAFGFGTVIINCVTPDVTIRYTTNGKEPSGPTINDGYTQVYCQPFNYNRPMLIKAKAFKTDMGDSETGRGSFPYPVKFSLNDINEDLDPDYNPYSPHNQEKDATSRESLAYIINLNQDKDGKALTGYVFHDDNTMKIVIGEFVAPEEWRENFDARNTGPLQFFMQLQNYLNDNISSKVKNQADKVEILDGELRKKTRVKWSNFNYKEINMFFRNNKEQRFTGIIGYAEAILNEKRVPDTPLSGKIIISYEEKETVAGKELIAIRTNPGFSGISLGIGTTVKGVDIGVSINYDFGSDSFPVYIDTSLEKKDIIAYAGDICLEVGTDEYFYSIIPAGKINISSHYKGPVEISDIYNSIGKSDFSVVGIWDISNSEYTLNVHHRKHGTGEKIRCSTKKQCGLCPPWTNYWHYNMWLVYWDFHCHDHGINNNKYGSGKNSGPSCWFFGDPEEKRITYSFGRGNSTGLANNQNNYNDSGVTYNHLQPTSSKIKNVNANATIAVQLPVSINNQTEPLIVEASGKQIMVFVAIDDADCIRLMYSIYDAVAGTWSDPRAVDNEYETVDLLPSIASDGNNIWIVWQRFSTTLEEGATLGEFLDAFKIVAARFDNTTESFTDFTVLADSVFLNESPKIVVKGNDLFVTWANDKNHSIYSLFEDGEEEYTIEESNIEIIGMLFTNNTWNAPITLANGLGMLVDMDAGFFDSKFQVAYIVDADNSIETFYDRSLIVVDSNGSITYAPTRDVQILNPKFTVINGTQVLSWFQGEIIAEEDWSRYIADIRNMTVDGQHRSLLTNPDMPTANFKILSNKMGGTAVVYPVEEADGSKLFYARMHQDGIFGNPFKLVETGGSARYYDAVLNSNGEFNIVYNNSVVVTEDADDNPIFNESNDLCAVKIAMPVNIRIADLHYFDGNLRLGEVLPISMQVQNIGGTQVDDIVIEVNGEIIDTIPISNGLQTGQTTGIDIELSIPADMQELTEFIIIVKPVGLVDMDMSDNSRTITLGRSNLSLLLEKQDNEDGTITVAADVRNQSDFPASAKLFVHHGSLEGDVLDFVELGTITGWNNILTMFTYYPAEIVSAGKDFELLYLRVESDKDELSIANKSGFVVVYAVDEQVVPVTGVRMNRNTLLLASGASETLIATVEPEDATNKEVTWSTTGDGTIATVNQSGVVTANNTGRAGSVTVTVTTEDGEHTASCVITVTFGATNSVIINGQEIGLDGSASGKGWSWNAVNNTLTMTGGNDDLGEIVFATDNDIALAVTGDTTATSIINTGTGTLTITSDTGKSLTLNANDGPAISACGDIVIDSGTVYALTVAANASAIQSMGGSVTISGTAIVTAETFVGSGSAISAMDNMNISTSVNVKATTSAGYSLEATAISITNGTTELFFNEEDGGDAFNFDFDPSFSGNETIVFVNGVQVYPVVASMHTEFTRLVRYYNTTPITYEEIQSDIRGSAPDYNIVTVGHTNINANGLPNRNAVEVRIDGVTNQTIYISNVNNQGVESAKVQMRETSEGSGIYAPTSLVNYSWNASNLFIPTYKLLIYADNTVIGTLTVTVVMTSATVPVSGVTISPKTASIVVGGTETLTATVLPSNATDKTVTWNSSNEDVATVVDGIVTGVSAGKATITVTTSDGGFSDTCEVTVTVPTIGVTLDKAYHLFHNGPVGTLQLRETVLPSNATDKTVTWSSNNEAVAKVNNSGLVTAMAAGYAVITVKTNNGGHTDVCRIHVNAPNIGDIIPLQPELPTGTPARINGSLVVSSEPMIFIPANPADISRKVDMLATMMPGISAADLHVDQFGIISVKDWVAKEIAEKLLSIDHAEVITIPVFEAILNNSGEVAAISFLVKGRHLMVDGLISKPENVRLLKVLSVNSGDWYTYTGTATGLDDKKFTVLKNMNNDIFTGDLVSGDDYKLLFMIKDGGGFDLDRQADGVVWDPMALVGVPVTGINLSPATLTLPIGSNHNLSTKVVITPSIADNPDVTWSSDTPSVAMVDASGVVTAVGAGTATITVTTVDGGLKANCAITVTGATPTVVKFTRLIRADVSTFPFIYYEIQNEISGSAPNFTITRSGGHTYINAQNMANNRNSVEVKIDGLTGQAVYISHTNSAGTESLKIRMTETSAGSGIYGASANYTLNGIASGNVTHKINIYADTVLIGSLTATITP